MSETAIAVWLGLVVNILAAGAAGLLNGPQWRDLLTIGAANELLGVVLVASPELLPRARSLAARLRTGFRALLKRVLAYVRSLFGRPTKHHVHVLDTAVGVDSALGIQVKRYVPPDDASREEKIAWLVERVKFLLERADALDQELPQKFDKVRGELTAGLSSAEVATRKALDELADRNIRLRLIGLFYVVFGIVLSWAGNIA
jgi:hypothetical protein